MEIKGRSYIDPSSFDDLKVGDRVRHKDGRYGTVIRWCPARGRWMIAFGRKGTKKQAEAVSWREVAFVRCVD